MDPYEVLGIDKNITEEELRKVFLRYAKDLHPDTAIDEKDRKIKEERFKEIAAAYNAIRSQMAPKTGVKGENKDKEERNYDKNYLLKRAHLLISKGDYHSAWEVLKFIDEESYEVSLLKGLSMFKKKKHHDAIRHYKKAADMNPWSPEPYVFLGEVYESINLKETARRFYSKALDIDPANKKAQSGIDRLNSKKEGAFSFFKRILKGKN